MPGFTGRGLFLKSSCALSLVLLMAVSVAAHGQKAPMVDVGVVVPRDVITGETVSGSVVTNPNDFANIAGLRVVKGQIPGVAGATPANLLSNYSLRIADNAVLPAGHPFRFTVTKDLSVRIFPISVVMAA
jgi:hypothetical protein